MGQWWSWRTQTARQAVEEEAPDPSPAPDAAATEEAAEEEAEQARAPEEEAEQARATKEASGDRARLAGAEAGRMLAGRATGLRTPEHPTGARARYFVVLRGRSDLPEQRGVFPRWQRGRNGQMGAREAVIDEDGVQGEDVVYHAFPTINEVNIFCAAAGVSVPARRP